MRTFNSETAVAAIALQQMVVDYWRDVDFNWGHSAAEFYAEDCVAEIGANSYKGHAGIKKYYAEREAGIRAEEQGGVRTTRHGIINLQISFESDKRATLNFVIVTFAGAGKAPVFDCTTPVLVSDARFECRCDADGQWRIFGFHGAAVFISNDPFGKARALGGR